MRNGDIEEGCQGPLLGLRPQNGTDGRGAAPARPLGSGATAILEGYPLGPLDGRRKGLRWRKQELMTCQTQLNCLQCHAPHLGLSGGHMPVCLVMCSHSTRGRQQFWLISLLPCLTVKKSLLFQTPRQSRVSCFLTIVWISHQFSWAFGCCFSFRRLLLRQVSPRSVRKSLSVIQSGWHQGQADREPMNALSGWCSLFGTEGTDLLVKEGILAPSLQVPVGRGRMETPGLQLCGKGVSLAEGTPH